VKSREKSVLHGWIPRDGCVPKEEAKTDTWRIEDSPIKGSKTPSYSNCMFFQAGNLKEGSPQCCQWSGAKGREGVRWTIECILQSLSNG
jgi:hypothetical protein